MNKVRVALNSLAVAGALAYGTKGTQAWSTCYNPPTCPRFSTCEGDAFMGECEVVCLCWNPNCVQTPGIQGCWEPCGEVDCLHS